MTAQENVYLLLEKAEIIHWPEKEMTSQVVWGILGTGYDKRVCVFTCEKLSRIMVYRKCPVRKNIFNKRFSILIQYISSFFRRLASEHCKDSV